MSSLVAYGSSDDTESEEESKNSETEDKSQTNSDTLIIENEKILEQCDASFESSSLFRSLPPPKTRDCEYDEENEDEFLDIRTVNSNANEIPTTKKPGRTPLVLPSVSHKPGKDNKNHDILRVGQPVKKEKSVRIPVPALSAYDSDDEEEEPDKKKVKWNKGMSGLFSMLPSPRNVTTTTNQSLIPQSVLKPKNVKKAPPLPQMKSCPPSSSVTTTLNEEATNDSDDEGEVVSFFSFHEKDEKLVESKIESIVCEEILKENLNSCEAKAFINNAEVNSPCCQTVLQQETPVCKNSPESMVEMAQSYVEPVNPLEIDDEVLLRLQGKRRHKQEEISIIDVSQQDQLSQSAEWLIKDLSEEKSSRAHRIKSHLPTAQQRRKHQITYLAFQAKERELELKNQWSQNRLTRRQTQSKYGF